jgi:hypothetical protein
MGATPDPTVEERHNMLKNVGKADRVVRLFAAGLLAFLSATPAVNGWMAYTSLGIAAVLAITAIIGFCPFYRALGVNSCEHGGTYHSGEDPFDGRAGN